MITPTAVVVIKLPAAVLFALMARIGVLKVVATVVFEISPSTKPKIEPAPVGKTKPKLPPVVLASDWYVAISSI